MLGTANLASNYGICSANLSKTTSLKKIIKLINKNKIFYIDTAFGYKNAHQKLGSLNIKKFRIITKLPNFKKNLKKGEIKIELLRLVKKALKIIKIKSFYAILIHNTDLLKGKNGQIIYKLLLELKKKKIVQKIGYSIYSPNELNKFFDKYKPDIIQGPLNVFDQDLIRTGWLKKLHKNKVEFHARSIFLQGILLKNNNHMPKYFKKFKKVFDNYYSWLKKNNLSPFVACTNFVFFNEFVKKIVIGIDSEKHLNEVLNLKIIKKNYKFEELICNNKKITKPKFWKIK